MRGSWKSGLGVLALSSERNARQQREVFERDGDQRRSTALNVCQHAHTRRGDNPEGTAAAAATGYATVRRAI